MYSQEFNENVIDHFMSPRNAGTIPDADAIGSSGDPKCGDSLTLYLKIKNDRIEDIRFLVFGCVAAIATSSMTTILVKGKTLEEAAQLTDEDITNALGGLPEHKLHCSVLGADALKNAIDNYYFLQTEKGAIEQGIPMLGKIPINADLVALCDNCEIEKINKNYLCGCEETLEDLNIEGDDK